MFFRLKISKTFFYIFVFFLPWQTRIIFTPEKTEFLSFGIYLSEIFLWLALAWWLTSADLKKIPLLNPPPRGGGGRVGERVLMFFCFFIFLSIFWSPDKVAAFRLWLYIFDGIMVYLFLREHKEWRAAAAKIFLFSMFIAASFGIWQFFNLGSPAEKWLGLASRGAWNLGDIVAESGGGRWLRAYGPFPHPNIFGGYLAAGILLLFSLLSSRPKRSEVERSHTENKRVRFLGFAGASLEMTFFYFLGAVLFFALFLTFSRSAWLALAISVLFLPLVIKGEARRGMFKFILFLSIITIVLSTIFWPFVRTRATSAGRLEKKSNTERVESWRQGLALWRENPIFGSGLANYSVSVIPSAAEGSHTYEISPRASLGRNDIGVQPPHNIFILVLAEFGLAGFLIYLFVWKKFWNNPAARPFLILFFIIGMLDHYLWTLYSGTVLFWLGLGMIKAEDANGGKDVHPSLVRGNRQDFD